MSFEVPEFNDWKWVWVSKKKEKLFEILTSYCLSFHVFSMYTSSYLKVSLVCGHTGDGSSYVFYIGRGDVKTNVEEVNFGRRRDSVRQRTEEYCI